MVEPNAQLLHAISYGSTQVSEESLSVTVSASAVRVSHCFLLPISSHTGMAGLLMLNLSTDIHKHYFFLTEFYVSNWYFWRWREQTGASTWDQHMLSHVHSTTYYIIEKCGWYNNIASKYIYCHSTSAKPEAKFDVHSSSICTHRSNA